MTEQAGCPERIYLDSRRNIRGHVCGRPVKGDGLCGIHLAAKRRREESNARWEAQWAAERADRKRAADAAIRLSAVLGVDCDYGRTKVYVPVDAVERWLDQMSGGTP